MHHGVLSLLDVFSLECSMHEMMEITIAQAQTPRCKILVILHIKLIETSNYRGTITGSC